MTETTDTPTIAGQTALVVELTEKLASAKTLLTDLIAAERKQAREAAAARSASLKAAHSVLHKSRGAKKTEAPAEDGALPEPAVLKERKGKGKKS